MNGFKMTDFLLTLLFFLLAGALLIGAIMPIIALLTYMGGVLGFILFLYFLVVCIVSIAWYFDFRSNPFKLFFGKNK